MLGRATFGLCAVLALASAAVLPAHAATQEQGVRDAAPSGLLVGVSRINIDPPPNAPQMNWGSATHVLAEGIDPVGMFATVLVLSDGRQKFVVVDLDMGGPGGMEPVIERAARETGIPASNIRMTASHTHAGPSLSSGKGPAGLDLSVYQPIMDHYKSAVADKIVGAIHEAASRLQPAHMSGGRGIGTININRRFRGGAHGPAAVGLNPDGFVDRELVVFRIDDAKGNPLAVLVNFQAHGTVLAFENKLISPDWPGMMRKTVEEAFPGATALFFQGAAGNHGPIEGFSGDLGVAHRLGKTLGLQAAAVAATIDTVKRAPVFDGYVESTAYQARQYYRVSGPNDQTLKYATRTISVPRRSYERGEIEKMQASVAEAKKRVDAFPAGDDSLPAYQAKARLRRLSDLLQRWTKAPDTAPVQIQLHVLRIGDLAIVSMPGEPFGEIGAAVKKASPFKYTMFSGYSSGVGSGYMPIDSEYSHGGYEVEGTHYGKGSSDLVVKSAIDLLKDLR